MTPQETAAATAGPVSAFGMQFYMAPQVAESMEAAGFDDMLSRYMMGRGGVLGDVASDVVVSAFALFHPAAIEAPWAAGRAQGSPAAAATAFAEGLGRWGQDTFGHLDGLDDFVSATRTAIDACAPMSTALYAGWRAIPQPDSAAAAAALTLQVLRELRFGFHVHALSAVGLSPVEAIVVNATEQDGNPGRAGFFGWSEPWPDPAPLRETHARAEEMTSARMTDFYEAVDATQRAHIATTVSAIASAAQQ